MAKLAAVVAAVERDHADRPEPHPDLHAGSGWWARLRARVLQWIAEKIAEQRLLWRLSGRQTVLVFHPAALDAARVHEIVRGHLSGEIRRHTGWLVVDGLGGLLSLALMPFPGPNMIGYYFVFRIAGHLLALRGARHGLKAVRWDTTPSPILQRLERLCERSREECDATVDEVAESLGLPRLPGFYRRAAGNAA
jgi:hypothetical protein